MIPRDSDGNRPFLPYLRGLFTFRRVQKHISLFHFLLRQWAPCRAGEGGILRRTIRSDARCLLRKFVLIFYSKSQISSHGRSSNNLSTRETWVPIQQDFLTPKSGLIMASKQFELPPVLKLFSLGLWTQLEIWHLTTKHGKFWRNSYLASLFSSPPSMPPSPALVHYVGATQTIRTYLFVWGRGLRFLRAMTSFLQEGACCETAQPRELKDDMPRVRQKFLVVVGILSIWSTIAIK